jgi:hypothetical protein
VHRKILAVSALLTLALALATAACGGSDHESHAQSLYRAYRAAEDMRDEAEGRLRQAFADISTAAHKEDSDAVLAAAERGQEAAAETDRLLSAELEAANGLAEIDLTAAQAKRLADGLEASRQSLALVVKELEIAVDDPILAERADEVNDLAKRSADLAVEGELAIRRADRALALALGLEPRLDQMFTTTTD